MPPLTDVEVRQAFANIGLQIPAGRSPDTVQAFYRILWNSGFLDCGGCACSFYTGTGAPCDDACALHHLGKRLAGVHALRVALAAVDK